MTRNGSLITLQRQCPDWTDRLSDRHPSMLQRLCAQQRLRPGEGHFYQIQRKQSGEGGEDYGNDRNSEISLYEIAMCH